VLFPTGGPLEQSLYLNDNDHDAAVAAADDERIDFSGIIDCGHRYIFRG